MRIVRCKDSEKDRHALHNTLDIVQKGAYYPFFCDFLLSIIYFFINSKILVKYFTEHIRKLEYMP